MKKCILVLLIFVASLLGSPHCAAMCGGFVALSGQSERPAQSQAAYHLGRLCTYLALGVAAGFVGTAINSIGAQADLPRAAAIVTGSLLIANGIVMLFGRTPKLHQIFPLNYFFSLHQKLLAKRSRNSTFPFALGLFSTLLPCGWLYSYVIVAAGAASPVWSALVMLAFWAGTLPLLVTVGSLTNVISIPLQKYVPSIVSLLLIAAGFFSIATHLDLLPLSHSGMHHGDPMILDGHSHSH